MFARKIAGLVMLGCPAILAAQKPLAPPFAGQIKPSATAPQPTSGNAGRSAGAVVPMAAVMKPPVAPAAPIVRSPRAVVMPQQYQPHAQQQLQASQAASSRAVAVPVPEAPLPVLLPLPAANPKGPVEVEFKQGKLTVVANNAEMGKVLGMIAAKTGADIQVAPEAASEPVVIRLGPGSPDEILGALLSGSRNDFIILGADQDGRVRKVVVTRRASFGREPVVAAKATPEESEPERLQAHDAEPQGNLHPEWQSGPQQAPQPTAPPF